MSRSLVSVTSRSRRSPWTKPTPPSPAWAPAAAAVAGGVPIIANISQCLSANEITEIHAILNGTSNYILTRMDEEDCDYRAALAAAQREGYAEADPTMDVDGSDAAQKLAILAHL